ncbi:MAG TPA: bifunctional phosphoribosylaminoimidazolecarboxamide formyltransferase/IMP cyclohydrolase [Blastocatellia bacterium]
MRPGPVRRALLSVSDKSGLIEFAGRLAKHSIELVSTGGTAKALADAGLTVHEVSELTGFPEILGGRVKTLHPKVHGGLLAIRDDAEHRRQIETNGIQYIDLVVVNLYPFVKTSLRPGVEAQEVVENIDIGGPSMIRSAAKNFAYVTVVTDPNDYDGIADELDSSGGTVSAETRLSLARKAFETTARYDAAIAGFFADSLLLESESLRIQRQDRLPKLLTLIATKESDLRYGENPHQRAALYQQEGWNRASVRQLQGRELSFNNLIDLDAAWSLVSDLESPACAIIKHTNPCGAARGVDAAGAFRGALATDPVSAFGGIVGFNTPVTEQAAQEIATIFFEVIVAPEYSKGALEILASRRNLRVMEIAEDRGHGGRPMDIRITRAGILVQDADTGKLDEANLRVVTARKPTDEEMRALRFAWTVAKHVKSNAIVYARDGQLVGVGAGQMSRVDSVKLGATKAILPLAGTVVASDAYFPFRDGVDEAARAGITALIQPGGSIRDNEVIAAADDHDLAMVFTGIRHFKH